MCKTLAQHLLPALVIGFLAGAVTPSGAEVPANGVAELDKAATQFVALLKEPANKASPPRVTDEKAKTIFAALVDYPKILGQKPYSAQDIQPLLSIFSGYFTLTKVYMEFRGANARPQANGNEVDFQDELTPLAVGMLDAGGALSQALTDQVNSKPAADFSEEEKARLAKLRLGISQIFSSAVSIIQNPQYSDQNKATLARALAANGDLFRDIIPVGERANSVNAATQAIMYASKDVEGDMNVFINSLKSEECTGLCALK